MVASRSLADDAGAGPWKVIFDGKSLKGWKANEHPEGWTIEDGVLVGRGPRTHLFYLADDVKDFELKADAKISKGGNSGIYFHVKFHEPGWFYDGHEVQIDNTHADPVRTGSLWAVAKLHESPVKDDEWFRMHVRVQGRNAMVWINDKLVVDYDDGGIPACAASVTDISPSSNTIRAAWRGSKRDVPHAATRSRGSSGRPEMLTVTFLTTTLQESDHETGRQVQFAS